MPVKTLVLFEEIPESTNFMVFEGDYSHLAGVYINSGALPDEEEELSALVYDDNGRFKIPLIEAPTKDWDYFIKCGLLL